MDPMGCDWMALNWLERDCNFIRIWFDTQGYKGILYNEEYAYMGVSENGDTPKIMLIGKYARNDQA